MQNLSFDLFMPWIVNVLTTFAESGLKVFLIMGLAFLISRSMHLALPRMNKLLVKTRSVDEKDPEAQEKRITTITSLLSTIVVTLIWIIALLMTLEQLGLDVAPVLASAGILGLAIGFGAQNLIRDMISGFFLILENQVRVGDVAIVNGTGGLVETINFRTLTLRDLSGVVHVFPNGTITTLANRTKGWSAYVMEIGVAYKEDTDKVTEVMKEVGEDMQRDSVYGAKILEPMEIFGVDQFGNSAVVIKARLKTIPIQQWFVGREYLRRLKKAFDAKGIEIPFPHRTLYMGEASHPFKFESLIRTAS